MLTPKFFTSTLLDSPMEELSRPLESIDEAIHGEHEHEQESRPQTVSPSAMMRAPLLPASATRREASQETAPVEARLAAMLSGPSQDEARQALQIVVRFIEQQPSGFLELQEGMLVGKLMEKLRLQR